MKAIRWIVINGLFAAFFLLENEMPVFVFNGGFFLIWLLTIAMLVLMSLGVFAIVIDDTIPEKLEKSLPKNPRWYYILDAGFDLVMLFILAGMAHYTYAVFYAAANVSVYAFRSAVRSK